MQNGHEIEIREAVGRDAAAIADVQVSAWKIAYRGMIPEVVLNAMTVVERTARWTEILAISPRSTLVASDSGGLIGWSGFGKSRDEDRSPMSANIAEVYGLYVHPDKWRSGTGRLLWNATSGRLASDGFSAVDVWVLKANERARRLYESVGCQLDASVTKMFEGDGFAVPEVRYSLTL